MNESSSQIVGWLGPCTRLLACVLAVYPLTLGSQTYAQDYLSVIASSTDFETITVRGGGPFDILREGKYWAPASEDPTLLPTAYQNVNIHRLHPDFLVEVFPDRFAGFSLNDLFALVMRETPRQYFAGGIFSFQIDDGVVFYGFDSVADYIDPSELLTQQEASRLYNTLAESFLLRPFYYSPIHPFAIEEAGNWADPSFPVYLPGMVQEPTYDAYTLGTNYGRVRLLTVEQLNQANACGQFSWQDILVLDEVPFDIEGVMAGLITGELQGELAHTRIRLARRGTPNAFVEDAHEELAPYDGQLVRLTIGEDDYTVETGVDPADAQAWWNDHRPSVTNTIAPNFEYSSLDNVLEMDVEEVGGPLPGKFGGKAAGLAKMYSFLPSEYQVPGFAIPFKYYHEFMTTNLISDFRESPMVMRTYDEYLNLLFQDPLFQTDAEYRCAELERFRNYARSNGQVNAVLVSELGERIEEVYGSPLDMVRFRSSSNAEDSILFNGAGLYDSTSVCVEDTFDSDGDGPSHCDPNQNKERTIERALKKVWASLWNFRAYEEREYFQIPQDQVAMGILVTTAFPNEAANGVAFTGDPIAGREAGYIINVQIGDYSVVELDSCPELDILDMDNGQVVGINRSRSSCLVPEGEHVLSDEQLETLGVAIAIVDANMPLDLGGYAREDVLLDIEFKFTQAGQLIFKQVRPFLRTRATLSTATISNTKSDINGDGIVDARDLMILLNDWNEESSP